MRLEVAPLTRTPSQPGGRPRSAAALLAYRLKIEVREPDGRTVDYSRGRHAIRLPVQAPDWAPAWVRDPQAMADAIEAAADRSTRRADARLFREDRLQLDRRLPTSELAAVSAAYLAPYAEAGEVVHSAIHLYGEALPASSDAGQHAYAEAETNGWPVIDGHTVRAPDGPHLRRVVQRDGTAAVLVYQPHLHALRTTRHLLPEGFGTEDRERNSASLVREARKHACDVQNQVLVRHGFAADLDHRSRKERGDPTPARPYLPRALYNVVEAERRGRPSYEIDDRVTGPDLVAARSAAIAAQQAVANQLPDPLDVALSGPPGRLIKLGASTATAAIAELTSEPLIPTPTLLRGRIDDMSAELGQHSLRSTDSEQSILAAIRNSAARVSAAANDLSAQTSVPASLPHQLRRRSSHRADRGTGSVVVKGSRGDLRSAQPEAGWPIPRSANAGPPGRGNGLSQPSKPAPGGAHTSQPRHLDRTAPHPSAPPRTSESDGIYQRLKKWALAGIQYALRQIGPVSGLQIGSADHTAFLEGQNFVQKKPELAADPKNHEWAADVIAEAVTARVHRQVSARGEKEGALPPRPPRGGLPRDI